VLLMRMAKDLEEAAEIQQPPKREGRNMIMFLSPRKAAVTTKASAPKPARNKPEAPTVSSGAPGDAAES
jgi:translation initiation factor IF-3